MSICKRDPRSGKVTTGGIVTVKDSTDNWYLSWTINRQPQFCLLYTSGAHPPHKCRTAAACKYAVEESAGNGPAGGTKSDKEM